MHKFQRRNTPDIDPNLRLIGVVYYFVGVILAALGILIFMIAFTDESDGLGMLYVLIGAIVSLLGFLQIFAGYGLRNQSSWRFEASILSGISILLLFPFGTVIGLAELFGVVPRYRRSAHRNSRGTYHADW